MNDFHPLFFGDKPDVLIEFEKLCTVVYERTRGSFERFVVTPQESVALTYYYTGVCQDVERLRSEMRAGNVVGARVSMIINPVTRNPVPIEVIDPHPQPTANLDDTVELPLDIEGRTEIVTVRQLVQRYNNQRESIEWFQART